MSQGLSLYELRTSYDSLVSFQLVCYTSLVRKELQVTLPVVFCTKLPTLGNLSSIFSSYLTDTTQAIVGLMVTVVVTSFPGL